MNTFDISYRAFGSGYIGLYRMARWGDHKLVSDKDGKAIRYSHPYDAHMAATAAFLKELNSDVRHWRGPCGEDARQAAEAHFKTRATDGESEAQTEADA